MSGRTTVWAPLIAALLVSGCAGPWMSRGEAPSPLLDPAGEEMRQAPPERFKVLFETTAGDFVVEVVEEWAPEGAERFYNLVRHGYFEGVRFFRVIPGFVAQFGIHPEPEIAAHWLRATIRDDPVEASNRRGTLTFATSGPDARTVQLFVNLADNQRLDAMGFAPIGEVTGGMDAVDRLYGEYGEGAPTGRGPLQGRIQEEGEAYLASDFPELDRILGTRILLP